MPDEIEKKEEAAPKKARGGWVGAHLDHLESLSPEKLPEEDRFLLRRALRVHAEEGGIEDRQLLGHVRKLYAKHGPK
jgi:hypothetical protein